MALTVFKTGSGRHKRPGWVRLPHVPASPLKAYKALGRQLRGVKGKEAIKALVKAGGILRGGKGDHVNIKMPNGQVITIPGKGELKVGLLNAAIKKAGLTVEKFLDLL